MIQIRQKTPKIPLPNARINVLLRINHMTFEDEESIYNLIPKPPPVIVKEPLHVSQFDGITGFATVQKRPHATMGEPADHIHKDPHDFLKKRSLRHDLPPKPIVPSHGNATLLKPPVPLPKVSRSVELPRRDFILENWRAAPKTTRLHPEVIPTFYTQKKDFGKVPRYLNRVKKETSAESAYWQEVRESMMPEDTETHCRLVSEEERIELLNGLQANLADIKRRYSALSFGQDHISFRKRKEKMEADMAQLEADIATFSRQNVYITEN
jgi:hypothetical protein